MKTVLPKSISTVEEAKVFLLALYNNNEVYHPEDDAHDIIWDGVTVSDAEADQLNKLMNDIYSLDDYTMFNGKELTFDPCEFLNSLDDSVFVADLRTENTGGGVMVDFITLKDGRIIAIGDNGIYVCSSLQSFDNGEYLAVIN